MDERLLELTHPYPRYGLAVALVEARENRATLDAQSLASVLVEAIENGLEHFRMETQNDPAISETLLFVPIRAHNLRQNLGLVQGNLAIQGKYLFPSVLTTDKEAKKTFDSANKILNELNQGKSLGDKLPMSRSFAPTTAKINNGRASQAPPKGSLLEAACSIVTALTPTKAAAWIGTRNTVIIPDLPLSEMRDFIELFSNMMRAQLDGNLMEARLPHRQQPTEVDVQPRRRRTKRTTETAATPQFKRPRLFNGNYPFAPRHGAFGPAGLLAAIGKWSLAANETAWAERVLESIAGTKARPGVPMYIISYDGISQVQFTHYVVKLSLAGELSRIIDGLIRGTQILSEIESKSRSFNAPAYSLFYLMANRFLQQFSRPAFRDFLATRAEYSPQTKGLFEVYFMEARKIDKGIVESARALGQWLNRTAYFVADSEVKPEVADRNAKVRKEKAKILVEFESAAMSARTPQDMLHRISTRAGRLLQSDMPAEAKDFIVATASGDGIPEPADALHLLVTFMRLRSEKVKELETDGNSGE